MYKISNIREYLSVQILIVFFSAVLIGGFFTAAFAKSENDEYVKISNVVSPELFNSAFAPVGKSGGKIIPASCSIGEPCDASDGFCPCPDPNSNVSPTSATAPTNGYVAWSYNATNAGTCDLSTTMSTPGIGPTYAFTGGAVSNVYNAGPFGNASGWVRYTVTCWNVTKTISDIESILITTTPTVITKVQFSSGDPFLAINSFTGTLDDDTDGTLNWSVNGATSCTASGGSGGWSNSPVVAIPTGSRYVSYTGTNPYRRYFTLTCTNGPDVQARTTSIYFVGTGGGCFIAGTKVRMADGSLRDIETVLEGELILTSNGPGTIEKLWHIPYKGNLYAFNGSDNYFVTDSHPFMTTEGWKSFNPEKTKIESPDLEVSLLQVGDTLLKEDGSATLLGSVDTKYAEQMVYNFKVSGSEDYYADGYWVHNPIIKSIQ